jgi:hypothetical protein
VRCGQRSADLPLRFSSTDSIVGADRKMVRYRSCRPPDIELRAGLRDLANERRRSAIGLFILLRREVEASGVNRIHRPYRERGLSVHKRRARRKAAGTRASRARVRSATAPISISSKVRRNRSRHFWSELPLRTRRRLKGTICRAANGAVSGVT